MLQCYLHSGERQRHLPTERNPYSYFILEKHLPVLKFDFITEGMKDEASIRRMQIDLEKQ